MLYRTRQTGEFAKWFEELRDQRAKPDCGAHPAGRSGEFWRLQGNWRLGQRIADRFGAWISGLFAIRDQALVILLCGGGKDSQRRDIDRAKVLARQL